MDSNNSRVQQRARNEARIAAFTSVVECYRDIQSLHPLQAAKIDPASLRGRALGPVAVEFLVDVQRTVRFALNEDPELIEAFAAVLAEEPVEAKLTERIVSKCGQAFISRGLQPYSYFRVIKARTRGEASVIRLLCRECGELQAVRDGSTKNDVTVRLKCGHSRTTGLLPLTAGHVGLENLGTADGMRLFPLERGV